MSARSNCPRWFTWLLMVATLFIAAAKSYAAPVISGLVPNSAIAGGPQFTLTVNGSGFGGLLITATVRWNGSARQTTFVSSTQLTAVITAADIANAGTAQVTVRNQPTVGGPQTSASVAFAINNPVPVISSLSPLSAVAGGPDFTLTINGSNFVAGSTVRFGGSNRSTTFVSASQLTALIPKNDIKQPGAASVTVTNPGPGGGTSSAVSFAITSALIITTSSPLPAGAAGTPYSQTLTASGGMLPYTWSITTGSLPAGLSLDPSTGVLSGTPSVSGTFQFTVLVADGNQPQASSVSKVFSLTVGTSVPGLTSLNPSSTAAGGQGFTLTVNGSNFLSGSTVRWNGSNRTTTFVSNAQLTATIPATDIAAQGTASITVLNPGPSTSNALTFTISAPGLTITTNSPLPQGTVGTSYSQPLAASGGTPPYAWSISSGSLPAGLALGASNGTISGTPSIAGNSTFTVQVSDSTVTSATKQFQLSITAPSAPVLNSINPNSTPAGGPAFTLTVNGANFVSNSTVRWNGVNRTTTFVSTSQLTAAIPTTDIAAQGTASITVLNPGPSTSNALTFTISAPGLTITTNSPLPQGTVGTSYSQTLAASGGTPPYTWSISSGSLPPGLALGASNGTIGGTPSATGSSTFTVQVSDSTVTSATKQFQLSITAPSAPVLNSINPNSTPAGGPAFTLTVSGTNFVSSSAVRWNGVNRTTAFVSSSQLTAAIPATDIAAQGTASITVLNPGPSTSNALTFTISAPSLTITTNSPLPQGTVGTSYSQALAASGGTPPYAWSVSSGSLPPGLALGASNGTISGTPSIAGNSSFTVQVSDSAVASTAKQFQLSITPPSAPVLNSINPNSTPAGGPAFTLTVNGTNFVSNSTVRWNGVNRTTTFVSTSQLTAAIPATDIAAPGTASITVLNPGPSTSNALTFTISALGLTITTNSPLPQGTVGTSYSQTLAASGGIAPYTWSVSSGSLPAGLTLDANGIIGGTPSATGNSAFTMQVRDSALSTATKQFQLSIASTTAPTFVISGASDSVEPLQQPSIEIGLASAYPSPISGQLTLKFTSNADVASDDPSIQFSTGGRTVNFSIPANSTRAVFANNASNIAFQTGTVAGTIDLTLSAQSGSPPTSFPPTGRTLTLSRRAPSITRLNIASRNASSFELAITGFSTPRSLTQATFLFTAAQGANLETSTVTVTLATAATNWFQSQTATPVGGQFRLQMPFAVQGEVTAIQSVSVTLTNGDGTSAASSVQF